jgi:hypothetical protein
VIPALLLSWVLAAEPPSPDVYAIVVGYNGGTRGLPPLRYADDDAIRMARVFETLAPKENIVLLTDWDAQSQERVDAAGWHISPPLAPTRSGILQAIERMAAQIEQRSSGRRAVFYFFYAGHGLPERLLVRPELGRDAALTGKELRAALSKVPAHQLTVLLDACRSQSLFVQRGKVTLGPDLGTDISQFERKVRDTQVGVLTAAVSNTGTAEAKSLGGGYFTHALASGLLGAADADSDGSVTYGELFAFVALYTQKLTATRPWFDPPRGDVHAVVADLRSAPQGVILRRESAGHFRLRDASGLWLWAELNKAVGMPVRLNAPPGRYLWERVAAQQDVTWTELEIRPKAWMDVASEKEAGPGTPGSVSAVRDAEGLPDAPPFDEPFTQSWVAALELGFVTAREPSVPATRPRHSLDFGYSISPGPLALRGSDNGFHLAYRWAWSFLQVGPWIDFRTSLQPSVAGEFGLRRLGLFAHVNAELISLPHVIVAPGLWLGLRTLWTHSPPGLPTYADPAAPCVGSGLVLDVDLVSHLAVTANARAEAAWVRLDAGRVLFLSFVGGAGFSYRF